jgi:hypothetical protein
MLQVNDLSMLRSNNFVSILQLLAHYAFYFRPHGWGSLTSGVELSRRISKFFGAVI